MNDSFICNIHTYIRGAVEVMVGESDASRQRPCLFTDRMDLPLSQPTVTARATKQACTHLVDDFAEALHEGVAGDGLARAVL